MSTCLIEQLLLEIESSVTSKDKLTPFLVFIHSLVSKLLNEPSEEKRSILEKNELLSVSEIVDLQRLRDLIAFLGFYEEDTYFFYKNSDENRIKLQRCRRVLEVQLGYEEGIYLREGFVNQAGSNHLSSSNNRLNTTENRQESSVKEITCSRRVKDLLLSRHLKKERSNDMNARITKDFSFNTNGYFHQSVSGFQRTTKRNKSFIKELFHQRNSSGYNTKLI